MEKHINFMKNGIFRLALIITICCFFSIPVFAANASLDSTSEYYLKSVAYPDKAVNVYVDSTSQIVNKTAVNLYKIDKSKTQLYTFKKNSKNHYLMIPSGSKYTVNVSSLKSDTKVFTWKNNASNNEYFIIESTSDGYYTLRMENKSSLYLTALSSGALTLKAKASSGNSQKFAIVNYTKEKGASTTTPSTTTPVVTAGSKILAVPVIRQTDERWASKEYVKGAFPKCTIGGYGCLLTSVTAVMSYYKHTVYRPDQYYKKLSFTQVKPAKGKYKKATLEERSRSAGNMKAIKGWNNSVKYDLKKIKNRIDKGHPVIVGGLGSAGFHYVVVTGYKNGGKTAADYTIMDPSRQSTNLQQHISKFGTSMYYKK